jgi:SanA protein
MKRFPLLFWRLFLLLIVCGLGTAGVLAVTNWWVLRGTKGRIVHRSKDLQVHDVGLVLGTAPKLRGGWKNPFFEARMNAAAMLFREGKVRHLLVSGDNGSKGYDEPSAMRDALVDRGVPAKAVTLDYAGFRTLDSVERARTVFGLKKAVIITDDFHLPRSLFLARAKGLNAVGFRPQPVPWKWSKKTRTREVISRVKACLDIYVLRTKPRFGGPREEIRLVQTR